MLTKTLSKRYFDEHVRCLPGIYSNTKAAPETLKLFSQTVDVLFQVSTRFGPHPVLFRAHQPARCFI
jgi:hypothetical protein